MMGLIESEKVITDIQGIASEVCMKSPYDPEWFTRLHNRQSEIIRIIEMQPKVDAEPVRHAKIITVTDQHHMMHQRCSGCDKELEWNEYPNYCPHCGAKLDEGVER